MAKRQSKKEKGGEQENTVEDEDIDESVAPSTTQGLTSNRGEKPIFRNKKCLMQLMKYFESPFKADKLFGVKYME